MGKSKKTRWILIAVAVVCLLAMLFGLLACGGGTLTVHEKIPPLDHYQKDYEVYMGLRIGFVTVAAATPWGVLLRCRIPSDYYTVKWYEKNSKEYEITDTATTRWVFLRPGESLLCCVEEGYSLDFVSWVFTYFND